MQYKILKDTPTIKAGAIFEKLSVPYEAYFNFDCGKSEYTIQEVENNPEWFCEASNNWRSIKGDVYFYVSEDLIVHSTEDDSFHDDFMFKEDNYFKTGEQAEEASRRIKKVLMDYHAEIKE